MKSNIKHIAIAFIIWAFAVSVIYLTGAFMAWEFDPSKWPSEGRMLSGLLSVSQIMIALFYLENKKVL